MIDETYLIKMRDIMSDYYFHLNNVFFEDEIVPIIVDESDCK